MIISEESVTFSSRSMVDDFGRVFFYKDKIFRAIHNSKKEFCLSLLNSDLFKELFSKKLIPFTQIADFSLSNYDLILEHEKLTETFQHEWSFSMLKDAAMMVGSVNEICNSHGYELKDAHTMNVLFRGTQPVWIDIGSIIPFKKETGNSWMAYREYVGSFILPLLFWAEGEFYISRKLLESVFYRVELLPNQQYNESKLFPLLKNNVQVFGFRFRNSTLFTTKKRNHRLGFFISKINRILIKLRMGHFSYEAEWLPYDSIKRLLAELKAPVVSSDWENYHSHYYSENGKLKTSGRFNQIIEIIKNRENEIQSVLDLAGNQGLLCRLLAENTSLKRIILSDFDSNAVDIAYHNFKQGKSENIELMLLNFMFTQNADGTASRVKSDLVMALAVTHHLVLTNLYSLDAIFERVKMFANRFIMIEFMPLGLWVFGSKDYPALPEWYNEEWFSLTFQRHFNLLQKATLEENRILYFGELIGNNS